MIPFTEHVARGLSRLGSKWRRKPNFVALLTSFLEEIQELDDALADLDRFLSLDNAFGAGLDLWGKRLKLERRGLTDASYRIRLKVRLLVIRSSGKANELIQIFKLLAPAPDWSVRWTPRYPAGQELEVSGAAVVEGNDFAQVLQDAKAGGVRSVFRWSPAAETDTFCLDGGAGLGLSSLAHPTVGGRLSRAKG